MALVDPIPRKFPVPHEPNEWFELRRLSWKQLKLARKKQEEADREDMKALGAEFVAVMMHQAHDETDDQHDARIERAKRVIDKRQWDVDQFDRETLLMKGIALWSYGQPVGADTIEQLDEVTADWAARQLIELSRPLTEAEQKNGSAGSTPS